jgi:hypothetical protein
VTKNKITDGSKEHKGRLESMLLTWWKTSSPQKNVDYVTSKYPEGLQKIYKSYIETKTDKTNQINKTDFIILKYFFRYLPDIKIIPFYNEINGGNYDNFAEMFAMHLPFIVDQSEINICILSIFQCWYSYERNT